MIYIIVIQYQISLVLPIYNQERYLNDTLSSLLQQTFTDFEIICVDDKSTDDSVRIIRSFMETAPNIVLIQNPENMGTFKTRANGVLATRSKYIMQFDADDQFISNTVLDDLSKFLGSGMDIYHFSENWYVDGSPVQVQEDQFARASIKNQNWANPQIQFLYGKEIRNNFIYYRISNLVHGKIFSRNVYLHAAGYMQNLGHIVYSDDYAIMYAITYFAKSYQGIPDYFGYIYNLRDNSVVGNLSSKVSKYIQDNKAIFEEIYRLMFSQQNANFIMHQLEYRDQTQFFMKQMKAYDINSKFKICRSIHIGFLEDINYQDAVHDLCGIYPSWDYRQMVCLPGDY
ncbi:Glycosyl_transferase family 2 protein [Hexamita inflata]|uniref:Glycosyl transferase family 2 protein n=1 Tax=Hexamita inflata TaxID=28002 RepID=A0AA86RFY2_9EUKA|nr:Glycosyl transferase family 2 protein [Hexamita inflata]